MYWITESLLSDRAGNQKNKYDLLNNMNVPLTKRIKEYLNNFKMKELKENCKYSVNQIIYDNSVIQYFNPNIENSHFIQLEYILPILYNLGSEIKENVLTHLLPQLKRCCKKWKGDILISNILILSKIKSSLVSEILELVAPNLFSCFIYYQHE